MLNNNFDDNASDSAPNPMVTWASPRDIRGVLEANDNDDDTRRNNDSAVDEAKDGDIWEFNLIPPERSAQERTFDSSHGLRSTTLEPSVETDSYDFALSSTEEAFRRGVNIRSRDEVRERTRAKVESSLTVKMQDAYGETTLTTPMINRHLGESHAALSDANANEHDGRKYRLFFTPMDKKVLDSYCFRLIGEGTTACVRVNRQQSHRNGRLMMPLPGEAYVMKSAERIFVEPHANTNFIEPTVEKSWRSSRKPMSEWVELFRALESKREGQQGAGELIDNVAILDEQKSLKSSLLHRTPAKRKLKSFLDLGIDESILAEPTNVFSTGDTSKLSVSESSQLMAQTLHQMDAKIQTLTKISSILKSQMVDIHTDVRSSSLSLDSKWSHIYGVIGKKPKLISQEYDAPDLWSVL